MKASSERLPSLARQRALFVSAALALLVLALALPQEAHFSGDAGIKRLAMESFASFEDWPPRISWPAEALDPGAELRPAYTTRAEGGLLAIFPYPYALIAGLLMPLVGSAAPRLVSLVFALVAALLVGRLVERASGDRSRGASAAWLALVATPLSFYALAVWEHSLGASLVLAGLLALWAALDAPSPRASRAALMAGLALGAAAWVRSETIVFAPLCLLLVRRETGRSASLLAALAGGLASILGLALVQLLLFGRFLPVHLAANVEEQAVLEVGWLEARYALWRELFAPDPFTGAALVVVLVASAAAWRWREAAPALARLFALAAPTAALALLLGAPLVRVLFLGEGPAESFPLRSASGTWLFAAALPLALLQVPDLRARRSRVLLAGGALFAMVAYAGLSPLPGGFQWGARFFLPSALLLFAFVVSRGAPSAWARALFALVLAASVTVQALGVALLFWVTEGHRQVCALVESASERGEVIVSETRYLPELLAPLWEQRRILELEGQAAEELARRLAEGQESFLVVGVEGERSGAARPFEEALAREGAIACAEPRSERTRGRTLRLVRCGPTQGEAARARGAQVGREASFSSSP